MSDGRPTRRSIFTGLLLILLGVFFLYGNLHPELRIWDLFERYWPVILILWGIAKLIDYFAAQATGHTPPRTFTVGEFFLLLLLLLVAGTVAGIRELDAHPDIDWGDWPFGRTYSTAEELAPLPAPPHASVTVQVPRGDIEIQAEDIAEIRVLARKEVTTFRGRNAEEWLKRLAVSVQKVGESYEVRAQQQGERRGRIAAHLEVHLPKGATVLASTGDGHVQVRGLGGKLAVEAARGGVAISEAGGNVEVEVRGGEVHISAVQGNVRVKGRGGDIELTDIKGMAAIDGEFFGPITVSNARDGASFVSSRSNLTIGPLPGRLELSGGRLKLFDVQGEVSLTTRDKDIALENIHGRIRVQNRNGPVEVRFSKPPRYPIEIANESGHVILTLPEKSAFEINAQSRSGEIESAFSDPGLKLLREERSPSLTGKAGGGGPSIQITNSYGTIELRKSR